MTTVTLEARTMADHARTLAALAAGLDHSFVQAGIALGDGIAVADRIVTALTGVEAALDDGVAGNPGDGLVTVAARLAGLPEEQTTRRATFGGAAPAAKLLVDHVAEIHQTLRLLGIYAMNVKVIAMGAPDLVGIMDEMTARMEVGETDIRLFRAEIELLVTSLGRIDVAEQALTAECARILPAAPIRLGDQATALQGYRQGVVDMARRSGELAGAIRTQVGAALGALQIGDSTRQRLEHVVTALGMLDQVTADATVDSDTVHSTECHVLPLLAAQLHATADDFEREATSVVAALVAIVPQADALRGMRGDGGSPDGGDGFLHDLEGSVAEIEALTRRLRSADAETEAAVTTIVRLVDAMVSRTAMVRRLQRHVQQLAFNIDLKSRRLASNGGIIVAADHIRRVANQLDNAAIGITAAIDTLEAIGSTVRAANTATVDPGAMLTSLMTAIREGAVQSDRAAEAAGDAAARMLRMLTTTSTGLQDKIRVGATIRAIGDRLAASAADAPSSPPDDRSPLHTLMPAIARLYTMAAEREVHQRHLLPGMAPVHVEPAGVDDDDFLDDGLF